MKILHAILTFLGLRKRSKDISETPSDTTTTIQPLYNQQMSETAELKAEGFLEQFVYEQPKTYPIALRSTIPSINSNVISIERKDKGALEDYFFDYATGHLGENFCNDKSIVFSSYNITPDFTYIDRERNLFIAIEIDEPYSVNNLNELYPIHYCGIDDNRNRSLLNSGWHLIRFSEEQIIKFPKLCIDFTLSFINTAPQKLPNEFTSEVWSYQDALRMISEKHRDSYLPFNFLNRAKTTANSSFRRFKVDYATRLPTKNGYCIMLGLYTHKKFLKDSRSFETVGYHECWIPEESFWENFGQSSVGRLLKNKFATKISYEVFLGPAHFEASGYVQGKCFNLCDKLNFRLVYPHEFTQLVNLKGTKINYVEVLIEYIAMLKARQQ